MHSFCTGPQRRAILGLAAKRGTGPHVPPFPSTSDRVIIAVAVSLPPIPAAATSRSQAAIAATALATGHRPSAPAAALLPHSLAVHAVPRLHRHTRAAHPQPIRSPFAAHPQPIRSPSAPSTSGQSRPRVPLTPAPRPRRPVDSAAAPSSPSPSPQLLLTSPSTHAESEHGRLLDSRLTVILGSALTRRQTPTCAFPMTTAVASPPTFQSLPRLGWNGANTGGGFSAMSTEDVSRIFIPQRKPHLTNGDSALPAKKKARGGFWPISKAESTSGLSSARANGSVQLSGKGPVLPALPAQNLQTNGLRPSNTAVPPETGAILALQPINGTFDRKQINVPFFPDVLRVGRQTNAKTVPTPTNGYFDSKVLSRQHAEVWAERSGKVWIRDVKSSNGTFVNGQRLSHENKESEPHELHPQDTLELGIDIVSEDQKTIVHHKVSARVEYVGLPAPSNNVLDLSFGDLDPSHSTSLLPSPMSTPMMHSRSRPGPPLSNGRSSGPPSLGASQMSAGQGRQMNFWGQTTPLSVEQLVKSIAVELRAARQQATEIDQVGFYLDAFPNPEGNARKDKADSPVAREGKNKFKSPRTDHLTRFADPPAPPPQQPLPEKPDSAKTSPVNGLSLSSLLKRADTARPKDSPAASTASAASNTQNSQLLQLIEALSVAKKELDSQATRVKQLEDMLKEERSARADAEERAHRLEHAAAARPVTRVEHAVDPSSSTPDEHDASVKAADTAPVNPLSTGQVNLQQKLDATLAEMQRMKAEMDGWKRRADAAESDATTARESLAAMIDRLREENLGHEDGLTSIVDLSADAPDPPSALKSLTHANGHVRTPRVPLEHVVTTVLRKDENGEVLISAPYVSMLGVVLIGVGLMAYLNSWQKTDR
ncbi:hypothetical protein DV736_g4604, partial [Chaetothyriales sp. CBS 134916]